MNILICNEQETIDLDERFLQTLREFAGFVLKHERAGDNIELSVALVEENEIRNLNAVYRGKDTSTDVLSFEIDSGKPGDLDVEEEQPARADDALRIGQPAGIQRMLGDVVICPSVAMRRADEFGQTFEQEMTLLLTHGILHLLGYDHANDSEAEAMEAKEREVLAGLSSNRSINTRAMNPDEETDGNR
jgi:probable rRNA maturation factor